MIKRLLVLSLFVVAVMASASRLSSAQDTPPRPARDFDTGQLSIARASGAASNIQSQSAPIAPLSVTGVSDWSKLTYQSYIGNWDIFAANGDGTNAMRLTSAGAPDITPRFNRGATRVAYASSEPGNYEIYTIAPNGSGKTRVTNNGANDYNPAWSPDGSKIVFNSYRDGQSEIYVMSANGTSPIRLTNNPAYEGQSVWSPDSTKIAFLSDRSGGSRIWVMNADGGGATQLTTQSYSEDAAWSPDGTQIAYDADADGDGWQELMVVNADGTNPHVIGDTNTTADMWARSWSPDGRSVAFTAIYYVYYQGSWYWTAAYSRALDTTSGSIFSLGGSDVDWMPDWQTTDVLPPTSSLTALPVTSPSSFTVRWSGADVGAGLASYDVQVKDGMGGAWQDWQTATTSNLGSYSGVGGHTYYFRVRARDNSSNLEAWPAAPDTSTTIEAFPPVSSVNALPAFAKYQVVVSWDGYDPGGSNIQAYDVQYRDGLNGAWTTWLTSTLNTKATFSGSGGHTYFFRTRAIDKAQNLENWPAGDGDALTQFYLWAISGTASDNAGTPISGITITTQPMAQATLTSDLNGIYAAYVMTDSAIYTTTWSKPGYGSLPPTPFQDHFVQMPSPQQGVLPAQYNGGPAFVTISNLVVGQRYRLIVKGTWEYTFGVLIDAQWAQHPACSIPTDFCYYSPNVGFNGVYRAAQNAQSMVDPDHEYTYVWTADGPVVQLNLGDSQYWDNSGNLSFEIIPDSVNDSQLDAVLPPQANVITNGDFESNDLSPWMTGNELTPTLTTTVKYTGRNSVLLGNLESSSLGDSILSQVVTVPVEHPVVSFLYQSNNTPPALLQNLAAYWPLNETSGTRHDGTGTGIDLEDHNGVGATLGKVGTAADFSPAAHTYLNHLDNANLSMGDIDFTITGWAYLTDKSAYRVIASKGTSSIYAGQEFELFYTNNAGAIDRFGFFVQNGSGQGAVYADAAGPPALNTWYFITAWHNASEDTINIQVNNGAIDSVPWSGGSQDSAAEFVLGRRASYEPEFYWSGRIDDVGIWKRLLTAEERAALYNEGQGCTYPFPTCAWTTNSSALMPQASPSFAIEASDGVTTSTLHSESIATQDWTHRWFDLSAWSGQTVTVTFVVDQGDVNTMRGAVYLDDVSIGSAYTDAWASIKAPTTSPRGTQVVYEVNYGNRGGAPTGSTLITATLSTDVVDIQTNLPPLTTTIGLSWDVGNLPAKSDSFTLLITATIAPTATTFSTLVNQVVIEPASTEIEKLNNSAVAESYVGWRTFLPVIRHW